MKKYRVLSALLALFLLFSGCASRAPSASSTAPTTPSSAAPPASSGAADAAPGADPGTGGGEADKGSMDADGVSPGEAPGPSSGRPAQSGVLTAGEWNDNDHWEFFQGVLTAGQDWHLYQKNWSLTPTRRISVCVRSSGNPVRGASVSLLDSSGQAIFGAVTDFSGTAYLFPGLFSNPQEREAASVRADFGGRSAQLPLQDIPAAEASPITLELPAVQSPSPALDLMLVFDTTGSMTDELSYLQAELEGVVSRVKEENGNLPIRLSVNFYRDEGDQYVVRPFPFTTSVSGALRDLRAQHATGGGDYEEAVEQALENALHEHDWSQESVKLLFLILDAPPHNTPEITTKMHMLMKDAAAQGIRIIPVASSGVDQETEFLMRTIAAATGGTYVFLTDDSGVGESHLAPTIGPYTVERLDNLLVSIIHRYLQVIQAA